MQTPAKTTDNLHSPVRDSPHKSGDARPSAPIFAPLPNDARELTRIAAREWPGGREKLQPQIPQSGRPNLGEIISWDDYVAGVEACNTYWQNDTKFPYRFSVIGKTWSWAHTISRGRSIAQREDWENLTLEERRMLLGGQTNDAAGAWELLGNMSAAGWARHYFYNNSEVRKQIRQALQMVIISENKEEFVEAAVSAIEEITALTGFGPAIATRLITLARPDLGISVNNGSAPCLSRLTLLPIGHLISGQDYAQLLQWVYQKQWHRTGEPRDEFERLIWSMRAALIDCFVYG